MRSTSSEKESKTVSLEETIDFLNDAIRTDSKAMENLFESRVLCNQEMADHPTIQVMSLDGKYLVGLIGILNGLFGVDEYGWGPIAAVWDDGGLIGVRKSNPEQDKSETYEIDNSGRRIPKSDETNAQKAQ